MSDFIVYLNGEYLPQSQAKVSVMDRGFLFAEAVYEIIPIYQGKLFCFEEHLSRLRYSLNAVGIPLDWTLNQWQEIALHLMVQHMGLPSLTLYIQVTRGTGAARCYPLTENIEPTVFVACYPAHHSREDTGIKAITVPEIRWRRCDIKSTNLLATLFMQRMAEASGAKEAIIIDDQGNVVEASSSSVCIVEEGIIKTPPLSCELLGSITRERVLSLAKEHGVSYREESISQRRLFSAEEVWVLASSKQITPVIEIDNQPIGEGKPGFLWRRMIDYYQAKIQSV